MAQFLTQQDVDNFGPELLDVAQRAAAHVMGPHLMALGQENAELRNRLDQETRRNLNQQLDQQVPNWREIDQSSAWQQWLARPDPLSGVIRQTLLNNAIQQGHINRVVGFFRGFLQTGNDGSSYEMAHRARDRARQFGSGQQTYTRQQIAKFYEQRRKGFYDDQQWARLENEIVRAGAEGRISGGLDVNGR
jgi:hypothetical protein